MAAQSPRLRSFGQSLVEFAAAVPLLVLVLAISLDFSRVFYYHVAVTSAAREGARYGSMYPADTQGIVNRVVGEPSGTVTLDPSLVSVSVDGTSVRVTASFVMGTFTPLAATLWNGKVSATVVMPVIAGVGAAQAGSGGGGQDDDDDHGDGDGDGDDHENGDSDGSDDGNDHENGDGDGDDGH